MIMPSPWYFAVYLDGPRVRARVCVCVGVRGCRDGVHIVSFTNALATYTHRPTQTRKHFARIRWSAYLSITSGSTRLMPSSWLPRVVQFF